MFQVFAPPFLQLFDLALFLLVQLLEIEQHLELLLILFLRVRVLLILFLHLWLYLLLLGNQDLAVVMWGLFLLY
jgi:hypothetical protein